MMDFSRLPMLEESQFPALKWLRTPLDISGLEMRSTINSKESWPAFGKLALKRPKNLGTRAIIR